MRTSNKFTTISFIVGLILSPLGLASTEGLTLKLSRASVPANIPMHKGFYDGDSVYYIITDTNDKKHAEQITIKQKWRVELAPPLSSTPKESLAPVYLFTNGVKGDGVHGYQDEVFTNTPVQKNQYSAIRSVIHVAWKRPRKATVLASVQAVLDAKNAGKLKLDSSDVVLNMPQIVWPGGKMPVKEDKSLTDDTPYGGAQVLDINTNKMTVTFVAHRGWGPNGRTIYYIVTDASPSGPAKMMGVVDAPTVASTISSEAAINLFQFRNGIKGSGPKGFQAGIASAAPGDTNYSPLWRIWMVGWNNPTTATLLETTDDIFAKQAKGEVIATLARPMNSDHVVNCPFIDPFQNI